ncbi:putative nucleic acid-binding protein [Arabidopsis thaliana]
MMLANPLPFTALKSLKPYKNAWRIQVKLLHVWRQYSVKAGESIKIILVDEAGDKMYAAVRREKIKKFERCLTEGVWKIITTITLNPTSGQYRISDLKYKIGFVFKTTISPCDTVSDALFLSLAKFDIVEQACQESTDGIVVCLIRFAKINLYNDSRSVSNSFDVSQVFVDPTLAELGLFKQRWVSAKTVCTVLAIDTDWLWYYFCCRAHNKKVVKEEVIKLEDVKLPQKPRFWCEICNGFAKICRSQVSFGYISILWTKPVKLDACYSIVMQRKFLIEDPTVLLDVINGLKGKTFQFLLCIQRENIFGGYDSFTVLRVYTGNLADEIVQEDSDAYVDPSSLISIEHV